MITLPVPPSSSLELSSVLIDQLEHGETITLTKNGKVIAQIMPINSPTEPIKNEARLLGKWQIGLLKNKMTIADDFDAPLPKDLLDAFEGK